LNKSQTGSSIKTNFWPAVAALSGVPLIMVLGNSMLIPLLPDIRNALELTPVKTSMLITLFSIPAGLTIPLAGFLSDRFGRKTVIIPSLIIYGFGGVIAAIGSVFLKNIAYQVILSGRVIQGIGAAGTAPIAMALCSDLFKDVKRSRSLGAIESSNGLGKVISPILGSALGLIAWYAVFIFFPLIVIPVVVALWMMVKEPETDRSKQKMLQYIETFSISFKKNSGLLLSSYFSGAVVLMVLFGVLFYLSEYLEQHFGLDGIRKGLVLAIPVLFMSSASFVTGFIIKKKRFLMKCLVIAGLSLMTTSLVFLPFTGSVLIYFTAISLLGIGTGCVLPCLNTLITSAASIQERGLVTSLYGSVRFFGVAFGPPIYGFLMAKGTGIMFLSSAVLTLSGAILVLAFARLHNPAVKPPATFTFMPVPAKKPDKK